MGGRTWQPHERELLEAHVDNDNWVEDLHAALPDRTINALRVQMTKLKTEQGWADGYDMGGSSWAAEARIATQMLGEATLRVGMWS